MSKPSPIKIGAFRYQTKYGTDIILCVFRGGRRPPKITNKLLEKLGVSEPDLGGRESAEWCGLYKLSELPTWSKPRKKK